MGKELKGSYKAFAFILLLTLVMVAGCGGSENVSAVMEGDYGYRAEYFALPEGVLNSACIKTSGDRIYVDGINQYNRYVIYSMKTDGTDQRLDYEQQEDDNGSSNVFDVDAQGNLYLLTTEALEGVSGSENGRKYFLVKKDSQGNELLHKELADMGNILIYDMQRDKEGNILLFANNHIYIVGQDGGFPMDVDTAGYHLDNMFVTEDNRVMVSSANGTDAAIELREYLPEQKRFSEPYILEAHAHSFDIFNGAAGYDLLMKDSMDVYGYSFKTGKMTKLLNWIDSDINGFHSYAAAGLPDGRIVSVANNLQKNSSEVAILTRQTPEEAVEKEVLTMAAAYETMEDTVYDQIIAFNKTSQNYRITVNHYNGGAEALHADMLSGDMPDLLLVNDRTAFQSLSSKGLFADLYEMMAKDESFRKEDYLKNVFTAFETNGKLYSAVPYFDVFSIVGKTQDVGEKMGWTMDDLNALLSEKPEGTRILNHYSREKALAVGCCFSMEQWIDLKNKNADFNRSEFIKLLEFARKFPSQGDDAPSAKNNYDPDDKRKDLYSDGKVLLAETNLNGFDELLWLQKDIFREAITFIGFPTNNRNGSALSPAAQFAILDDSHHKEAAWEFIKQFYSDEFQDNLSHGWPVKLSALEKKKNQARENSAEENTVAEEVLKKAEAFLESLTQVLWYDENICDILTEEAQDYFDGRKSAEEAVKLIQERAQAYLDEIP